MQISQQFPYIVFKKRQELEFCSLFYLLRLHFFLFDAVLDTLNGCCDEVLNCESEKALCMRRKSTNGINKKQQVEKNYQNRTKWMADGRSN